MPGLRTRLANSGQPSCRDDAIKPHTLAALRYAGTGAAGLAEDLRAAFKLKFGVRLRRSYGMTEAPGPVAMVNVDGSHRPGR